MASEKEILHQLYLEENKIWFTIDQVEETCTLHFPMRDKNGSRPVYIIRKVGIDTEYTEKEGRRKTERSVCHVRKGVNLKLFHRATSQTELQKSDPVLENILYGVPKMDNTVSFMKENKRTFTDTPPSYKIRWSA
jgi:hypothetical protein